MFGGVILKDTTYLKPNMNNLKGKKGRAIMDEIRKLKPASHDTVRKEADECMERILAKRKNG